MPPKWVTSATIHRSAQSSKRRSNDNSARDTHGLAVWSPRLGQARSPQTTMLHMPSPDFAIDALPGLELHQALTELRQQGPIVPVTFLGTNAWLITTYEALEEAFRDTERFPPPAMYKYAIEPVFGRSFLSMDEPDHLIYRRLVTPAFRSRAVTHFAETGLPALAHEMIDAIEGAREIDLVHSYAERFPYLVISRMLGVPRDMENEFHRWSVAILAFAREPREAERCARELTDYLLPVIEQRRREPREDVISGLVTAEVDGRKLTTEEILSHIRMLFPTGGETTHSAMGNALYALLTTRNWERLVAEPECMPAIVEESLRWESPVSVLPRMSAARPTTFREVELAPDSWVMFAIAAANHDPAVYDRPDYFDADRFATPIDVSAPAGAASRPIDPLTFGRGPKSCPGLHLARQNLCVSLGILAERMPKLRLLDVEGARPCGLAPRGSPSLRVAVG